MAITVVIAAEVLAEAATRRTWCSLRPSGRTRAGEGAGAAPEVKVIDYTGSTGFGTWLEQQRAPGSVFTEKAGVNTVGRRLDRRLRGMLANLAFSCLSTAARCARPRRTSCPPRRHHQPTEPHSGRSTESG
jgi:hypothetical protein